MNRSEKRRILWKDRESQGLCIYCGGNPPKEGRKGCEGCLKKKVDTTVKFSKNNKETTAQYRLLVKHQVIEKYGNICACCGEDQVLFLTIDHKNNDGYQDRMSTYGIKNPATTSFYLKLRRESIRDDLQVLCFNCNLGKSINNGICPHETINKKLLPIYDKRHDPQFDTRLKIVWPDDDKLINMCNEISISQVAKILGVDFSAVSGRLKRRNKYHLVRKRTGAELSGKSNPAAKLSEMDILEIRKQCIDGVRRQDLAQQYKVSKSLIDKIVNRDIWKNVNE